MTSPAKYPEVEKLADELFTAIQTAQGYAYVSDGEQFPTTDQFVERVRGRLEWNRKATAVFVAFLRKHKQLR
jgi:hypothetical protein